MITKEKSTKKVFDNDNQQEKAIPEGMEGKARYKGVHIEEYAQKLLASQSVTNSATEKASRIEKGLYGQGYELDDIKTVVAQIMEDLLGG